MFILWRETIFSIKRVNLFASIVSKFLIFFVCNLLLIIRLDLSKSKWPNRLLESAFGDKLMLLFRKRRPNARVVGENKVMYRYLIPHSITAINISYGYLICSTVMRKICKAKSARMLPKKSAIAVAILINLRNKVCIRVLLKRLSVEYLREYCRVPRYSE